MHLYLHAGLFKADPDPKASSGVTMRIYEGPKKQRAAERMSPHMRVKPTKVAQTPRTMGGAYMRKVGSAEQREGVCKNCKVTFRGGGYEHVDDIQGVDVPKRVMIARAQGARYVKPTTATTEVKNKEGKIEKQVKTGHLLYHPDHLEVTEATTPERQKELGPPGYKHHTVGIKGKADRPIKSEHLDRELCPDCYEKWDKREVLASAKGKTPEQAGERAKTKLVQERGESWMASKEKAGLKRSLEVMGSMLEKAKKGAPKSDEWISNKISHLVKKEGKPQDQAIAIAYSMAGRSRGKVSKADSMAKDYGWGGKKEAEELAKPKKVDLPDLFGKKSPAERKHESRVREKMFAAGPKKSFVHKGVYLRLDLFKSQDPVFLSADLFKSEEHPLYESMAQVHRKLAQFHSVRAKGTKYLKEKDNHLQAVKQHVAAAHAMRSKDPNAFSASTDAINYSNSLHKRD